MKPIRLFILLFALCACSRFDPERDSDLSDLHVSVSAEKAFESFPESLYGNATLKLSVLVYSADTIVVSETVLGSPKETYSFLFPRLNKTHDYVVEAYGSFITEDKTDVWCILPQKLLRRLRAERIPHSFGALDWLGKDHADLGSFSRETYQLTLAPLGEPCKLILEDWKETDSYKVSLNDKTVIKLGPDANNDFVSTLTPVLDGDNPLWLCVFQDPSQTEITVTRDRNGLSASRTRKPVNEGGLWVAKYDFD